MLKGGWILTASNIDMSCIGVNAVELFSNATGREVFVINDADAAGVGEYRFGAVKDEMGTVIVLTFGTGIGSALLHRRAGWSRTWSSVRSSCGGFNPLSSTSRPRR